MSVYNRNRNRKIDELRNRVGLGRLLSKDERDKNHLLRAATRPLTAADLETRYWPMTVGALDQGSKPHCVAYAWTAFLFSAPMPHKIGALGPIAELTRAVYERAQYIDEWPGNDYDGTSVRAGAKALIEQKRIAGSYAWAFDAETARRFVLTRGTLVFGTNWHVEMYEPDSKGFLKPQGAIDGGHAYLIIGYSEERKAFRVLNSWGPGWGQQGRAWLRFDDAQKLIAADGEACSAIETKPV